MSKSQISSVNIVTYVNDSVQGVTSFKDNEEGNKEAERLFTNLIKENYSETTEEDIEASIDNGYFEEDNWQVFIVHSS